MTDKEVKSLLRQLQAASDLVYAATTAATAAQRSVEEAIEELARQLK